MDKTALEILEEFIGKEYQSSSMNMIDEVIAELYHNGYGNSYIISGNSDELLYNTKKFDVYITDILEYVAHIKTDNVCSKYWVDYIE